MQFQCSNKRCSNSFNSNEDTAIIKCPCCSQEILNRAKVINEHNFVWIESMFNNIQTYGIEGTFNLIDKHYIEPKIRIKVRQLFFETLKVLGKKLTKEGIVI